MKRPMEPGIASCHWMRTLTAFLAFGALASVRVHAGDPYLPLIGPPPMRIMTATDRAAAPLVVAAVTVTDKTNAAVATATKAVTTSDKAETAFHAGSTNSAANAVAVESSVNVLPRDQRPEPKPFVGPRSLSDGSPEEGFGASMLALPTPDLLGITPQTLASYFCPMRTGTNSAEFVGPFPLSFMPPLLPQPVSAQGKSSHAEYIVK